MGQREAADKTKKDFGLKSFSHTTLGRAMKKLEKLIEAIKPEAQTKKEADKTLSEVTVNVVFPTVEQTQKRKDTVITYLKEAAAKGGKPIQETIMPKYKRPPYKGDFIDTCHRIVGYTFINYHCLLL